MISFLFVSYSFGVVGSVFLIGVSVFLFGFSVFGRFENQGRYRYSAVLIEVIMGGVSVGVVGYVYSVAYISFRHSILLVSFILFGVSILGWFMSENKFVYHFIYEYVYNWGSSERRVLEDTPSKFELFLLDRMFEREVDFNTLFDSMEVCVVSIDSNEFQLTFVNNLDALLEEPSSGRERVCEICLSSTEESVEADWSIEKFRSRDISVSPKSVVCRECQDELLRVVVDKELLDESEVFVSRL